MHRNIIDETLRGPLTPRAIRDPRCPLTSMQIRGWLNMPADERAHQEAMIAHENLRGTPARYTLAEEVHRAEWRRANGYHLT